jgi:hypothetical protein
MVSCLFLTKRQLFGGHLTQPAKRDPSSLIFFFFFFFFCIFPRWVGFLKRPLAINTIAAGQEAARTAYAARAEYLHYVDIAGAAGGIGAFVYLAELRFYGAAAVTGMVQSFCMLVFPPLSI